MGGLRGWGEPAARLLLWRHLRWRELGRHPSAPGRPCSPPRPAAICHDRGRRPGTCQLGNLYRPGLSHGLSCGIGCA